MADINVRDLAEEAGLKIFDTALPLDWYNDVHDKTGLWPQSLGFVWCYDGATSWGYAVPLTSEAVDCLYSYHKMQVEASSGVPSGHSALIGSVGPDVNCRDCATINKMEYWLAVKGFTPMVGKVVPLHF